MEKRQNRSFGDNRFMARLLSGETETLVSPEIIHLHHQNIAQMALLCENQNVGYLRQLYYYF